MKTDETNGNKIEKKQTKKEKINDMNDSDKNEEIKEEKINRMKASKKNIKAKRKNDKQDERLYKMRPRKRVAYWK